MLYTDLTVDHVHDGDTLMLNINVFIKKMYYLGYCRLLNVWCPELSTGDAGKVATEALNDIIKGKKLSAEIKAVDKYGRPLTDLTFVFGRKKEIVSVNDQMIKNGYGLKKSIRWQVNNPKDNILVPNHVAAKKSTMVSNGVLVFTDFYNLPTLK